MSRDLPPNYFRQDDRRAPPRRAPKRAPSRATAQPAKLRRYEVDAIESVGPRTAFLHLLLPAATMDAYRATLARQLTIREFRRAQSRGELLTDSQVFSEALPDFDPNDLGDDAFERFLRMAGIQLGRFDARLRSVGEGTAAAAVGTVVMGAAATGAGALLRQQGITGPTDAVAAITETVEGAGLQLLTPDSDAPAIVLPAANDGARDAAIEAAETGLILYNQFDSSATAVAAADRAPGVVTNNRFEALSSILGGTNILFDLGLLRDDGALAPLGVDRLAGELTGKSQLESGLDSTAEAVRASTEDRARGLFQLKPETTLSLLGQHGHVLDDVPGLVPDNVRTALEAGMHRLGRLIEQGRIPASLISARDRAYMASLAKDYDFDDPGALRSHSNLFHIAYAHALTAAERQVFRQIVVDQTPQDYQGRYHGTRGGMLSATLAGVLADELDLSPALVESYGFRAFGYISHQAGEGAANRIARAVETRDALTPGTAEWRAADLRLKQTIFRGVSINQNQSVYVDRDRYNADLAETNRQRASRRQRPVASINLAPRHVRDWDNLVPHINAMFGVTENQNLPNAVAAISFAVRHDYIDLRAGDNNAVALQGAEPPTRTAVGDPERDPRVVRAPTG